MTGRSKLRDWDVDASFLITLPELDFMGSENSHLRLVFKTIFGLKCTLCTLAA